MSLHSYIEKLRAKPVRERERIAVIATAVGFSIILLIWVVSFKEMNKPSEQPVDQTSASLNDLKNNFQNGKDSIQNMMQQLPNQMGTAPTDNSVNSVSPSPNDNTNNSDGSQNMDNNSNIGNNNNPTDNSASGQKDNSVPPLP